MGAREVRKEINEARKALIKVMQTNLEEVASNLVADVMRAKKRATPAQQLKAIRKVTPRGAQAYQDKVKAALAEVAAAALKSARREVPKAKNTQLMESIDSMKLGEFERLPKDVQRRLLATSQLLVETQFADLQKAIYFQFTSSLDSTDSDDILTADLSESAANFIEGPSVLAGGGNLAAQAINTSRQAFFYDDDVLEQIEAFEFVNGDPVSPICEDLAGTIFAKDDPEARRYEPPLHHNCKSTIRPILVGNLGNREVSKLRPSKADLEKSITLTETGSSCVCCGSDR